MQNRTQTNSNRAAEPLVMGALSNCPSTFFSSFCFCSSWFIIDSDHSRSKNFTFIKIHREENMHHS